MLTPQQHHRSKRLQVQMTITACAAERGAHSAEQFDVANSAVSPPGMLLIGVLLILVVLQCCLQHAASADNRKTQGGASKCMQQFIAACPE